jgi:hypothetical protein
VALAIGRKHRNRLGSQILQTIDGSPKYRVHPEAVPAYANSAARPVQCAPTGLPTPHRPLRRASNDGRYPVLSLDLRQPRKKTLEAFVHQIESLSWAEPVLMIF